MNKVFLNGYLARDPVSRVTSKGLEQSNLVVAVNDIKNFDQTYFINCVAWGTSAKFANNYLKKGSFVAIDGRLSTRSYVSSDGQTKYVTEVIVDNLRNFGSKPTSDYRTDNANNANKFNENSYTSTLSSSDEKLQADMPTEPKNKSVHVNLDDVFKTDSHKKDADEGDSVNLDDLEWDEIFE